MLTASPAGPVCPQITVIFTCRTSSSFLRWMANTESEMVEQVTLVNGSSVSCRSRIVGGSHLLTAIIVSRTPELISNLTLVASPELDGLNVECESISTGREVGILQIASKSKLIICIIMDKH